MNWQATGAGPGGSGPPGDPFTHVETDIRAMVASPWWQGAPPPQRADAITRRMLAGAGEWWLFGAWGRWYRCGLDGNWHPCPPPADPRARQVVTPAPVGYGNPPMPPQFMPVGPDLAAGPVASTGFLGTTPETSVVARLQQALINALSVNPAQFALQDPTFAPGTPSTLAAAWGSLLWCAGSPVVLTEHPLIELFVPYLTVPGHQLRWLIPPDLSQLAAYYTTRLGAGDGVGASHVLRVMYEVAAGLRDDPRFRPGADALATIAEASLRMVPNDLAAARYGHAAIVQEWRRRCPADYAMPLLRDVAPGEYLRLAIYDLTQIIAGFQQEPAGHVEIRRTAIALLAADLHTVPNVVAAVLPWLDPDGARTLQAVAAEPAHPLRELWPREGRLPENLRIDDTAALEALLATSYATVLTSCRLAGSALPPGGFTVAGAASAELTSPALQPPKDTGELTPWQIIDAARAHLAAERASREAGGQAAAPRPGAEAAVPPAPHFDQAAPQPLPPTPGLPEPAAAPPPAADTAEPQSTGSGPGPDPGMAQWQDPYGAPQQNPPPYRPPGSPPPYGQQYEQQPYEPQQYQQHQQEPHAQPPHGPTGGRVTPPPEPGGFVPGPPLFPAGPFGGDPEETRQDRGGDPEETRQDHGRFAAAPAPGRPPAPQAPPPPPAEIASDVPAAPFGAPPYGAPAPAPPLPQLPDLPPPVPTAAQHPAADRTGAPAEPEPEPGAAPPPGMAVAPVVEAYGIRFLCGADDVERLVTEVRRRGKWAQRLRGQDVSSASAPALLLIGARSTGQRRLTRMIARALADVDVTSGEVHGAQAADLRQHGPEGVRAAIEEHAGHTLLLEGLDELVLEDGRGQDYAAAIYRTRVEGVSDTVLIATCEPDRFSALSSAAPELVTDFRAVRLPDLTDPGLRVALLALLAEERYVRLSAAAWEVVHADLGRLLGRGRLVNARLIETYFDRACARNLGRAAETQAIGSSGSLLLVPPDFEGLADELQGSASP